MKITPELIQHLCSLSKLEVEPLEMAALQNDLEKMVSFVEQLQQVNTEGVEPLLHMLNSSTSSKALRDDIVSNMVTRDSALANAPEKTATFFTVPKVISNPANQ
jgi:aspartyl-tRNA(Asn)/glutamyl-tRNA(Gln) amidotransferase subunit C